MSHHSALRSRLFGVLAVCAGATGLVGVFAGGCGGGVDADNPPATDSAVADTLTADAPVILDGSKDTADSSRPPTDTAVVHYDAPGSLFDVDIPDIVFEGGATAAGCYDCTKTKCKDELAACDKDEQCRGLVLCISVKCAGDTGDLTCVIGCATDFGVTPSPTDPVAAEALAVGQCTQKNCADKCPGIPTGTDAGAADTKGDTKADASDAETAAAFKSGEIPSGAAMSVDPAMLELAKQLSGQFNGHPELRQAVIDRLSH